LGAYSHHREIDANDPQRQILRRDNSVAIGGETDIAQTLSIGRK
jgi:hypothetical protein